MLFNIEHSGWKSEYFGVAFKRVRGMRDMRRAVSVVILLTVVLLASGWFSTYGAECWAENHSTLTTCAEDDNVNVPIFAPSVDLYHVIATHPDYCPCVYDGCPADFSGCPLGADGAESCSKIYDDGINIVRICSVSTWWRTSTMNVEVNGNGPVACHYLVIHRRITGASSWPEVLVFYQDGNMRIKPHPPTGYVDVCYGSSVIVGPATLGARPYADVETVQITTGSQLVELEIIYAGSETAHIVFRVDRTRAIADVMVGGFPDHIAVFRSMWVEDGNADVDFLETTTRSLPILSEWVTSTGTTWLFHRQFESSHNTSAPDIQIAVDTSSIFRVDETGTVYLDGDLHAASFQTSAADLAEWVRISEPVDKGDVLELDPLNPGSYRRSRSPCSVLVAGVVSTKPGIILGGRGSAREALLALAGIVPVKVVDEGGPIRPGDLLVASSMPGHAMRWAGGPEPCPCALIGKALGTLSAQRGTILALLSSH